MKHRLRTVIITLAVLNLFTPSQSRPTLTPPPLPLLVVPSTTLAPADATHDPAHTARPSPRS